MEATLVIRFREKRCGARIHLDFVQSTGDRLELVEAHCFQDDMSVMHIPMRGGVRTESMKR